MHNKIIKIITLVLIVSTLLTGCGTKEIPFSVSPEDSIENEYVEHMVANKDDYEFLYLGLATNAILGLEVKNFTGKMQEYEQKNEKYMEDFKFYSGLYTLVQTLPKETHDEEIPEAAKETIEVYLKNTRLKEDIKNTEKYYRYGEKFKEGNPDEKIKNYLEKNKITVEEIIFPDKLENVNMCLMPFEFTYRYIIKGKVKNKPFEQEVCQNFYFSYDENEGFIIEAIKDNNILDENSNNNNNK